MEGNKEEMLINLDSPEKNCNVVIHNHYLKNPLIPGPDLNCNELETNNPFDIVAQSAENWDPFELVLHQSLMHHERNNLSKVENERLVDGEFSSPIDNFRLNRSNSVSNNVRFFPTPEVQCDKSEEVLNISSRSLDNSPSLREKIKKVVKKRVSKCIERALTGNITPTDLNRNETTLPSKYQRSFSYNLKKKSSRFTESESQTYELKNFLEEAKQLSIILHNISINEEINGSSVNKNKKSPSNEDKIEPKVSFNEEDLMSIKPPWDDVDNGSSDSDDNSIGLPKIKLFYLKKKDKENRNELNQEKLAHYKKRIRASIDGNMSCEEESIIPETINKVVESEECQLEENKLVVKNLVLSQEGFKENEAPLDLLPVNEPVVPRMNDLRPKKGGNILKKGPLKAIVPLQKMTKTIAEKMSPLKKTSTSNRLQKKNNYDSNLSSVVIHPVASSTPNSKNLSNNNYKKCPVTTPQNNKSRPRLSRKDNDTRGQSVNNRRSVSLSMDVHKNSRSKQPFSFLNPNDNQKWKRPHTAPSPHSLQSSPSKKTLKKKDVQKHSKLSNIDKENQLQTY